MASDLISRSALIAYVKELPTYDPTDRGFVFKRYPSGLFAPDDIVKSIQYAPTVDAVEVVRCKDCKWAQPNEASDNWVNCHSFFESAQRKEWYCADGERRADDGK